MNRDEWRRRADAELNGEISGDDEGGQVPPDEGPPPPGDDDAPSGHRSRPSGGGAPGAGPGPVGPDDDAWGRGGGAADEASTDEPRRTFADMVRDAVARMRDRGSGKERPVPVPWAGTAAELHGGLWPGCHILVGGTKAGKTQWAFNLTYHALSRGVPCAYVGLELDELGIVARMIPFLIAARSPWRDYYYGRTDALYNLENHAAEVEQLASLPFYPETAEARRWDYDRMAGLVAGMRERHPEGPLLVVVDFLQLVTAPQSHERDSLREIIGAAAYAGRMAARTHGAAVLLLSSAARTHYPVFQGKSPDGKEGIALGTGDPGRFVGTGKESGEVEYSADTVLALCREPYDEGQVGPRATWLAVAASRTGTPDNGTGWIRYGFDGTTFRELERPKREPPSPPLKREPPKRSRPPDRALVNRAVSAIKAARETLGGMTEPAPTREVVTTVEEALKQETNALAELLRTEEATFDSFIVDVESRNGALAGRIRKRVKACKDRGDE